MELLKNTAVQSHYLSNLAAFSDGVRAYEQQYAIDHGFALTTWRQWSDAAPRLNATATEVMVTPSSMLPPIPSDATNIISVAAGWAHILALRLNGSVIAWGDNQVGETNVPASVTNVVAIAAAERHNLALRADGTVVGWGLDDYGQTHGALAGSNVVAIATGASHSLALKANGTVVGWGSNSFGQANPPPSATNVVAIAAGFLHSLALKADGTVVGWGRNEFGQATPPPGATSVVAITAGRYHSLALKADGTVIGWGLDDELTTGPSAGDGVVAIAAGYYHNLALRADGTVIAWGHGDEGQTTIPAGATNVIAIAASEYHSLFVAATQTGGFNGIGDSFVLRAQIPKRVGEFLYGVNGVVLTNLYDLHDAAIRLSGSKALLQALLELAMPWTLEQDDVLRGFLYRSESLMDLGVSRTFLEAQDARLRARPNARAQGLTEVAVLRYLRFADRLEARLNDFAATGQPEIPRLVDHTLRLLNLLRDAWALPANSPPPALELGRETNTLRLVLYGEPYARYTLQFRDSLSSSVWTTTTTTNWRNEQIIALPVIGTPQRYYRGMLPVP